MKNFYYILFSLIFITIMEIAKFFVNYPAFYAMISLQLVLFLSIIILLFTKIKFKKFCVAFFSIVFLFTSMPVVIALFKKVPFEMNFNYVAHAGGGIEDYSYLNSQEGFINFASAGYEYIEIDFLYTKDEKIVASHLFEHLEGYSFSNRPTLVEFTNTLLENKYHGITFDWLISNLKLYPNVKIIFDTKENKAIYILKEMVEISKNVGFDIFSRFIVQVYSYENYLEIKENGLNFENFWYTNYKSIYTFRQIDNYFGDKKDVTTIVLSKIDWWFLYQTGYDFKKTVAVHTVSSDTEIKFLATRGVDFIYIDKMQSLN